MYIFCLQRMSIAICSYFQTKQTYRSKQERTWAQTETLKYTLLTNENI